MAVHVLTLTTADEAALAYGIAHWPFGTPPADADIALAAAVEGFVLAPWREAKQAEDVVAVRTAVDGIAPEAQAVAVEVVRVLAALPPKDLPDALRRIKLLLDGGR